MMTRDEIIKQNADNLELLAWRVLEGSSKLTDEERKIAAGCIMVVVSDMRSNAALHDSKGE